MRAALAFAVKKLLRKSAPFELRLRLGVEGAALESLTVERSGLVRLQGWSRSGTPPEGLTLEIDGLALPLANRYGVHRPDLLQAQEALFAGFCLEWICDAGMVRTLALGHRGAILARAAPGLRLLRPHYRNLFDEAAVLHRADLYGEGPPLEEADPSIVRLAASLPGSILDFGCGSGALVRALRGAGRDALGLELRRPAIEERLRDDVRPFVTLYAGGRAPFEDGRFASAICSEVIEHIPEPEQAIAELARVTRGTVIVTVPDLSAVPSLFPHGVVPWHLLEGTHLNFFTQRSLERALGAAFPQVEIARINPIHLEGTQVFTSLVAICRRQGKLAR